MAGEEEQKKGEGKGFAGLSSLVSDVDTTPPPAAKKEPPAAAPSAGRPASQPAQPQPQPSQRQTYQEPAQPSSGSSGGKWVLGTAAVIGALWFIVQSDKSPTSPTPAYSPPAQTATPSYSPPAEPQAPSRPQESMPPVGQDLVLSTAQIRYCLAEDIRIEGAKSAINNHIDSDVDRFNSLVANYNSRCARFRYRSGALESARRDIEPYRSLFQAEGRSKFARPSTGSLSTPAPAPERSNPSKAVFSAQSHAAPGLESLTYDEKDAIETACILKRSEGAASYNRCVSGQLDALASAPRTPDLSRLSYDEKDAIETACILKRSEGAATYNRCLTSQLGALANAPRKPDLSGLAYDEKDAIETACILKRSEGAASYNRCLVAQLGALANAPRLPSLSGLAYDEKDAVETACILKRSEGAASYNRCVVAQLRALGR